MSQPVIPDYGEAKMGVAERCRLARVRAGMSQAEAARRLGWWRETITELEAGRRSLRAEETVALARQYGVLASWLLGEVAP